MFITCQISKKKYDLADYKKETDLKEVIHL